MTEIFKNNIEWRCQPFQALTLAEWYTISQAREQIFIVEQKCPYLDSDGQDIAAWHMTGNMNGTLTCYARILPPAPRFLHGEFADIKMPAIGRVLTVADYRGHGLASTLMKEALIHTLENFGKMPIYISAQVYLLKFYQQLGFITQGESYLEDDIPHQSMIKF